MKQTAMMQLLAQLKDERANMPLNIEWDRCYQAIEYVIQNTYIPLEKEQLDKAYYQGQESKYIGGPSYNELYSNN